MFIWYFLAMLTAICIQQTLRVPLQVTPSTKKESCHFILPSSITS
jgi:hypothetical protein